MINEFLTGDMCDNGEHFWLYICSDGWQQGFAISYGGIMIQIMYELKLQKMSENYKICNF